MSARGSVRHERPRSPRHERPRSPRTRSDVTTSNRADRVFRCIALFSLRWPCPRTVQWTCHRRTISAIHSTSLTSVPDAIYVCNNPLTAPRLARPTGSVDSQANSHRYPLVAPRSARPTGSKVSLATGGCFTGRTRRPGSCRGWSSWLADEALAPVARGHRGPQHDARIECEYCERERLDSPSGGMNH